MPNVFDGLLAIGMLATAVWGWKTGLLRQFVAATAALVAFMVAAQLYEPLAALVSDFAFVRTISFYQGLAYLLVMCFTAAVWFVAIRHVYPYSRLTAPGRPLYWLDSLAGMLLGLATGVLLTIATVGVAEVLVYGHWPVFDDSGARDSLHTAIQRSWVVRTFFQEAPGFADYVGHWVPGVAIAQDGRIQP